MAKYTIQMNYKASIVVDVVAQDEGEALDKARDKAEDADMRQFTLGGEMESTIISQEWFFPYFSIFNLFWWWGWFLSFLTTFLYFILVN